jgi:predicted O-methyltransferase YrrM
MSSIVDSPEAYFRQFIPPTDSLLQEIEAEADREHIPIVGPVVGELLFILARVTRARTVLELGTATGYSTIHLARACKMNAGSLISLELEAAMARRAEGNLERAGLRDTARIVVGDALATMAGMTAPVDLIFMDIEKADYLRALPHCRRLLRPGALLIADNVGFKDADGFNRAIAADGSWRSVSLFALLPGHSPEKDGLCLALRA